MLTNEEFKTWIIKNQKSKPYIHFDWKENSQNAKLIEYITNPKKISTHSFYPFLHIEIVQKKYNKEKGKYYKIRNINYPSHKDRLIFSYYSFILNKYYNFLVSTLGMNDNIIGYRNNLGNLNNIHFVKKVFHEIKKYKSCFIMTGDFSNFFDNLNHIYLKKQLLKVLNTDKLPNDWYAVFKNITAYSYCELDEIFKLKNLNKKDFFKLNFLFTPSEFRSLRKEQKLKINKNKTGVGIPQGTSLSSTLSNVYMLDFDKSIFDYVKKYKGNYFRYSDDFIIILPICEINTSKIENDIYSIIECIPNLKLQKEKTKIFTCNNGYIEPKNKLINYLGFSFNSKNIYIRDKTISKYYYRMYRKIKTIKRNNWITYKCNRINCKELYKRYSIKGSFIENNKNNKGNFLTYILKIEKILGEKDSKKIKKIRKRNLLKIRKYLKKIN